LETDLRKEVRLHNARKYGQRNKKAIRERQIKNFYNLSPNEYQNKLDLCGHRCEICQEVIDILCVDHDHKCCPSKKSCGKCLRGLLCKKCNAALGLYKDNLQIVRNAVTYLEKYATSSLPESSN